MIRRLLAVVAAFVIVATSGCVRGSDPALDALADALRAVPGVTQVGTSYTPEGKGAAKFRLDVALAADPTADVLQQTVETYGGKVGTLTGYTDCFLTWKQAGLDRRLWIMSSDTGFVPDTSYVRGMATWPSTLKLKASAGVGVFKTDLASSDDRFTEEVAQLAAANIATDRVEADSPRYGMAWDDAPPTELFEQTAAAALDATKVSVGVHRPTEGAADDGAIEVIWPAGDASAYQTQMHAVTDLWAAQQRPLWLSFTVGSTRYVGLDNATCPGAGNPDPGDAAIWEYATSDGRSIALAPASC